MGQPWPAFIAAAGLAAISLVAPPRAHAQAGAKITAIHVVGAQKYAEAQIVAASGLAPGQDFSVAALDTAAQKLGASGAFDDVRYRYQPQSGRVVVEFTVKENTQLHRYILDNFVWMPRGEVEDYLRKQVPLFGDALPATGTVLDDVAAALQQLLASLQIQARISHLSYGALNSPNWVHLFSVQGPAVKLQRVLFDGVHGMDVATLGSEARPLVGRDYSTVDCGTFGRATFVPLYREKGYLRATVGDPAARVAGPPGASGAYPVEATFPMVEGLSYKWDAAQWSGNQALAAADLDAAMDMKRGEIANGKKIDEGSDRIGQEYGKRGYIDAQVQLEPAYDDAARTVSYRAAISEGPQYRMGALRFSGTPPGLDERILAKWKLKPGDVYNASYARDYLSRDVSSFLTEGMPGPFTYDAQLQVNRDQRIVDINVVVTSK